MSAFWNVMVSNAQWLFGTGGAVVLLTGYLLLNRKDTAEPKRSNLKAGGSIRADGDIVLGNKTTGAGPLVIALILGFALAVTGLALMLGSGDTAISLGSGVANTGDITQIGGTQ